MALPFTFQTPPPLTLIKASEVNANFTYLDGAKLERAANLSDLASIVTARSNLGLGTAATANVGTSGATVPLLSTANAWGTTQTFTVAPVFTDQSATRTSLGLGTAATANVGTSGATVPLLSTANAWGTT